MIEFELLNQDPPMRAKGYATNAFVHAVISEPDDGASRFMRMLTGELPAQHRRVTYLDAAPNLMRISHEHLLLEPLTIADNLVEYWIARGFADERAHAYAVQALLSFNLMEVKDRYPDEVSELTRVQVTAARNLVQVHEGLLIDDPLANVAPEDMAEGLAWLSYLVEHASGVVLVHTGDPTVAMGLSDRVMMFNQGELVSHDTTHGVLRSPVNAWSDTHLGNTYRGNLHEGRITLPGGRSLYTFMQRYTGQVIAHVPPRAVSLSRERPVDATRNLWEGRIAGLEGIDDRVRVNVLAPIPIVAEVTPETVGSLMLPTGGPIWVSFKASMVSVTPIATAAQLARISGV